VTGGARVPLVALDDPDSAVQRVFATFAAEGREPIALYRVLANAPWLLEAYSGLARALRYEATLPRALRELVILRNAQLTGSDYEWSHHRALAEKAGVPDEKVAELERWRDSDRFGANERVALDCAEKVHRLGLDDATFAAVRAELGEPGAVELIFLCGFYELVGRVLQGLAVAVEPAYEPYLKLRPTA